ncbi:PRKCD [Cordylochernes scorpioides]|uniref:PRKCD n=1 Tax=Cordylochernes scorpioides TaxID=51811 RepID=A0ABY6KE91_9ARAC|nr:PRKCD [Cordylochernes scorpioides]
MNALFVFWVIYSCSLSAFFQIGSCTMHVLIHEVTQDVPQVMLAELKGTNQCFAIKCLKKTVVLEDRDVKSTMIERQVLTIGTSHPYICHLFCTFQSPVSLSYTESKTLRNKRVFWQQYLYFVMEYLCGGDVMFHILQNGRFKEDRARFYGAEVVSALKFLHKKGIVYRDAKLDNLVLDHEGHVRLVDFGMCKLHIYRRECMPCNLAGTPDYMAPEVVQGQPYNHAVDWWSFGVLLYEMLVGQSPFRGTDEDELFWCICNEQPYYPFYLSKDAKHILKLFMHKDPETRLGMPDCPEGDVTWQPFFKDIDWEKIERKELDPPFKPQVSENDDDDIAVSCLIIRYIIISGKIPKSRDHG